MSRTRRVGLAGGLLIAAGTGVGVGLGQGAPTGLVASLIVLAFVIVVEFGRGERARSLAGRADRSDERELAIHNEATLAAYLAVVAVALPGWLVGAAHGHFNQFGVVCAVGGGAQILAVLWLRTRR
jgi:hypothetical protein